MLRTHVQTSGWSLTEQTRTTTSSARRSRRWRRYSAAPSHCTPIPSTRRSRSRPTSRRASPATRSLIVQEETHITNVVDRGRVLPDGAAHPGHGRQGVGDHRGGESMGGMTSGPVRVGEAPHRGLRRREAGAHRSRRGRDRRREQVQARQGGPAADSRDRQLRGAHAQLARLAEVKRKRDGRRCSGRCRAHRGGEERQRQPARARDRRRAGAARPSAR